MNCLVPTQGKPPLSPHDLWNAWSFEPSVLLPIALAASIYVWGIRNVWQRAGTGHGINKRRLMSFLGVLLSLFVALVSPLDAMSDDLRRSPPMTWMRSIQRRQK